MDILCRTSPKTAYYIHNGGVIATLPGANSHGKRFLSGNIWKLSGKHHFFNANTVYSIAISCFSSRRVSKDSWVWNRNAEDCFTACIMHRADLCVLLQGADCQVYTSSVDTVLLFTSNNNSKNHFDIHYVSIIKMNALWESSVNSTFWTFPLLRLASKTRLTLYCVRSHTHVTRDRDNNTCCVTACYVLYTLSLVMKWNISYFLYLSNDLFFRFNSAVMDRV